MLNAAKFFWGFLRNPKRVGSIIPASERLAKFIAKNVPKNSDIIEVGAGTGVITKHLVKLDSMINVIEYDTNYFNFLVEKFKTHTNVELHNICASTMNNITFDDFRVKFNTKLSVVSSLPFLSMDKEIASYCKCAFINFLTFNKNSCIIQYTYRFPWNVPFEINPAKFKWTKLGTVYTNIPPATVWKLENK